MENKKTQHQIVSTLKRNKRERERERERDGVKGSNSKFI